MPEENARGLETLTTPSDFAVRDLGQSKPPPTPAALEDVDEEQLRAFLQTRGLEIRQIPKEYGVISGVQDVKQKKRLTIHLTPSLRQDLQLASAETGKKLSQIGEEALQEWMTRRGLRQPGR